MSRYTVTPRTTYVVTERKYPFTDYENQGIVLLRGSKPERFWRLMVHAGDDLSDPITSSPMGTIEATERRAVAANDEEMRLSEGYFHLMDRIERYDELLGGGVLEKDVNRTNMVKRANEIFQKWEISREIVKGYEESWVHYRDMRVNNLAEALEIHEAILDEEMKPYPRERRSDYPWWPSPLLISSIRNEIDQLNQGMRLSDRYMIQLTLAERTGRPLFSSSELTDDGFVVEDVYHRSPIKGSLEDRIALVLAI